MKGYSTYKETAVDWLGEIPLEWSVKSLKYIASAIIGLTFNPSEISFKLKGG